MAAPTMIRNNEPGPTVFTDEATKAHVEWQGAGDPNGLDIQAVPPNFLDNVQFRKAMITGILEKVSEKDLIASAENSHREEWEARQDKARNASSAVIDRPQDEDIVVLSCIGPKGKTGDLCGEQVSIKSKARFEKPPLCPKHAALKNQYIPEETGAMNGSQPEIRWSRPLMGLRERSQ